MESRAARLNPGPLARRGSARERVASYVSKELTHFVGAGLASDEERFQLLLEILRDGKLLDGRSLRRTEKRAVSWFDVHSSDGAEEHHDYFADPYFDTDLRKDLDTNDFVRPDMVCFCDIPHDPPDFFRVHTAKYNRFGVALSRDFLVRQGASPVFYVARQAPASMRLVGGEGPLADFYLDATYPSLFGEGRSRRRLYTEQASRILELIGTAGGNTQGQLDAHIPGESNAQQQKLNLYRTLDLPVTLFAYLFGYMKFFDPSLSEDHPDNYYMEREWRVLSQVSFAISDVVRIFLPPDHVQRLQKELPEYHGEVVTLPLGPAS